MIQKDTDIQIKRRVVDTLCMFMANDVLSVYRCRVLERSGVPYCEALFDFATFSCFILLSAVMQQTDRTQKQSAFEKEEKTLLGYSKKNVPISSHHNEKYGGFLTDLSSFSWPHPLPLFLFMSLFLSLFRLCLRVGRRARSCLCVQ